MTRKCFVFENQFVSYSYTIKETFGFDFESNIYVEVKDNVVETFVSFSLLEFGEMQSMTPN